MTASTILIIVLAALASGLLGFTLGVYFERDRWQR